MPKVVLGTLSDILCVTAWWCSLMGFLLGKDDRCPAAPSLPMRELIFVGTVCSSPCDLVYSCVATFCPSYSSCLANFSVTSEACVAL